MNKNIDSVFTTTDLALAAFIALRYPIVSVDKTNPKKAIFHFPKDKQLDELVDAYWRNET